MGTDHGNVDPGGGAGAADPDRISGLPDELLHDILIRLPGTADAARTSILSRRWRRVWAHTPVISLNYRCDFDPAVSPGGRATDRVDAALAAHAAGTGATTTTASAVSLNRLEITLPFHSTPHLRMDRLAAWLQVAAQHLAGELRIKLPFYHPSRGKDDDGGGVEVLLPLCEGATSISLDLSHRTLRFAPPPPAGGGVFRALDTLTLRFACVHGRELEAAVSSSRCPCLKKLVIEWIILLQQDDGDGACDLTIRSDSLEWLEISSSERLDGGRLRVHAPNLQTFHSYITCDLCVVAPKLSEVRWRSYDHAYDSSRHHLARAGHQLRRLEVDTDSSGSALMRQFNMIDELVLTVNLEQGVEEYERFLKCTDTLARCKVLLVKFWEIEHGFQPAMLHLLRKCAGIRRLVVQLKDSMAFFRATIVFVLPPPRLLQPAPTGGSVALPPPAHDFVAADDIGQGKSPSITHRLVLLPSRNPLPPPRAREASCDTHLAGGGSPAPFLPPTAATASSLLIASPPPRRPPPSSRRRSRPALDSASNPKVSEPSPASSTSPSSQGIPKIPGAPHEDAASLAAVLED